MHIYCVPLCLPSRYSHPSPLHLCVTVLTPTFDLSLPPLLTSLLSPSSVPSPFSLFSLLPSLPPLLSPSFPHSLLPSLPPPFTPSFPSLPPPLTPSVQILDKLLWYLRLVHSVDFYGNSSVPNEDSMPHRCGIITVRNNKPGFTLHQDEGLCTSTSLYCGVMWCCVVCGVWCVVWSGVVWCGVVW